MTPSFEQQLAELEKVVQKLERGDLPLEDNVKLFERGIELSNACRQQLAAAESRVQVLLNPESTDAGGSPRVEELGVAVDDLEGSEEELEDEAADDDGRL
jgi:exodeoxyribonuclease VII small subunit